MIASFVRLSALVLTALAAVACTTASPTANASAPQPTSKQNPGHYRVMVGDFEVVALSDGTLGFDTDKWLTNVNTGDKLVLVDTGSGALFEAVQLPYRSVTVVFDVDFKAAAAQRKKALADLAKQGTLIGAPHIAFPGLGRLRKDGNGFAWLPVNYSAKP